MVGCVFHELYAQRGKLGSVITAFGNFLVLLKFFEQTFLEFKLICPIVHECHFQIIHLKQGIENMLGRNILVRPLFAAEHSVLQRLVYF